MRPPEELARFLSGQAPTTIVAPPSAKSFELTVQVPVPDMANLANNSIWPDVEARLVDLIESHSSTIVFANSRRLAERLTARLNEIHAERCGAALSLVVVFFLAAGLYGYARLAGFGAMFREAKA